MLENKVGKIKSLTYNETTGDLEFTVLVTDNVFKKKFLKNLSLSGKLIVKGDEIFFEQESDATV